MPHRETSVFIIGYGNPARGDDGLGPACAEAIEALGLPGVAVQTNYQLQVEDATDIVSHDTVIFIDADADPGATHAYSFTRVDPEAEPAAAPAASPANNRVRASGCRLLRRGASRSA